MSKPPKASSLEQLKKLSPMKRLVHWVVQREQVRVLKEMGYEPPWTDDEILQKYRFTNVRRMDDKVSRWLMQNWYGPYFDHPNMLAAVALARFVNKPEALQWVTDAVLNRKGPPNWRIIKLVLRNIKQNGSTVFNGAYMVRGNSIKSPDKIGTVVDEYVRPMFEASFIGGVWEINRESMEKTHTKLQKHYGFGSFMAGQVVADLRWAMKGSWKDRMTWAPMGPGSARGLARLLCGKKDWKDMKYGGRPCDWLDDFRREVLGNVPSLLPRELSSKLEAHDYQNILCETDKYNRVLFGEGKPKQTYPGGER